jgi:hypothetical protein
MWTFGTPPTIAGSFGTFFKPDCSRAVHAEVRWVGKVIAREKPKRKSPTKEGENVHVKPNASP